MLKEFQNLSKEETDLVMDALPLVTVLISGADGDFSQAEKDWAIKLAQIRGYKSSQSIIEYYQKVEENFGDRMEQLIRELPSDTEMRNQLISQRLSGMNNIFGKLNNNLATRLYKDLLSFAEQIAKADGGFLRIAAINKHEGKWVKLPMIDPVVLEEESEEETD